jgi:hypothetical protein
LTPEDKVLDAIKQSIRTMAEQINQMKVTREEREAFEKTKSEYRLLVEDYKKHKEALIKREQCLK